MGAEIPHLSETAFNEQLSESLSLTYSTQCGQALYAHYLELRRWNQRLSLIGPGTAKEVLSRHYAESLAGRPLLEETDRILVDIGSGGGFPGFVLAAANPKLAVTLIEPRVRKWAFLKSSIRRSGLSCDCVNARVEQLLQQDFPREAEVITCRALTLGPTLLETLQEVSPRARLLLWCGVETPTLPNTLCIDRQIALTGSKHRRILEVIPR